MLTPKDLNTLQDLPIEQVSEDLQLRVRHHKTICPFHDDTHASLTFDTHKNRYRCYVCDAHGGVIDLVMNSLRLSFLEACQWLSQQYGLYIAGLKGSVDDLTKRAKIKWQKRQPSTVNCNQPDIAYLTRLMAQPIINEAASHFLFQERRLSRRVVTQLGISSISYSCPMSSSPHPAYFDGPALLIPYRDIHGNLLSVQSRYLGHDDKPRFRFPKGSQCHVFNIDSLARIAPEIPVYITEGVTDCLAMLSAGVASVAIPSATLLKPDDLQPLLTHPLRMYPDADAPGETLFQELKALCPNITRHTLPPGFKDIGQYYAFIHKND